MAKAMTFAQRVSQAKKWEVPLRIYPGAETRGRGPLGEMYAYVVHHTGSDSQSDAYLKFLAIDGRPDLPPPLCNDSTDMDGDVWLIAAGRANHAGAGSSRTRAAVLKATYTGNLTPGPDDLGGTACNGSTYGNEVRFDGGQPMTRAQWVSTVLDAASVCDWHGWSEHHVIGHKEHTGRKPDPGSTVMALLRADVRVALKAGPGNWPVPATDTEDDVTTPAQMAELKNFTEARTQAYAAWVAKHNDSMLAKATSQIGNAISAFAAAEKVDDAKTDKALGELRALVEELTKQDPATVTAMPLPAPAKAAS